MSLGLILAVVLIGFSSGLRTFTGIAVVAWAAHVDHIDLDGTPFEFMISHTAVLILSLAALGEYVFDLLPFVPPRTAIPGLVGRFITGSVSAAILLAATRHDIALCILGGIVAIGGAFAGYQARTLLVKKLAVKDFLIAIPEDCVAIGLAVAAVCFV